MSIQNSLSNNKTIFLFILPALLVFAAMVIIPIIMSGYYSVLEWDGIGPQKFTAFENYKNLFVNNTNGFYGSIVNSFILALCSVFLQLPIAFIFARFLSSGVKGESLFRSIYFIPVIVSTVVIGQMWLKIYNPQYGLLNKLLESIGLGSLSNEWLGNQATALPAVLVPLIWQYLGYHILLFYAGIKTIPKEIIEAAEIDGATGFQLTTRIIIPNIVSIIEICVILAVIGSIKTFDLIYILTNGGPLQVTEVPTTLMFRIIFHRSDYGLGSALAIIIILECLVFTVFIQKILKRFNPI